jgi:hypothetical protein
LHVIYVDTPSGKVEVSSSYVLSIFSSGADPQRAKSVTLEGSCPSVGELWPDIDKLDEIDGEGTSAVNIPEVMLRDKRSLASVERTDKRSRYRLRAILASLAMLLSRLTHC